MSAVKLGRLYAEEGIVSAQDAVDTYTWECPEASLAEIEVLRASYLAAMERLYGRGSVRS